MDIDDQPVVSVRRVRYNSVDLANAPLRYSMAIERFEPNKSVNLTRNLLALMIGFVHRELSCNSRTSYLVRLAARSCGMSFRKLKSHNGHLSHEWHAWIDLNRSELIAIGVPAEVFLDEARWSDFLQNGHLHWHESAGFEFGQLSPQQLAALNRFLERENGSGQQSPLLDWVRVRREHA